MHEKFEIPEELKDYLRSRDYFSPDPEHMDDISLGVWRDGTGWITFGPATTTEGSVTSVPGTVLIMVMSCIAQKMPFEIIASAPPGELAQFVSMRIF